MVDGPLLFDTNVLIYALNGTREGALRLLEARSDHAISLVTWMEIMVGHPEGKARETEEFLETFLVLEIGREVARAAVELRRESRMKLPDAIIYATALQANRTLVTYNTRDFGRDWNGIHVPVD